MSSFAKLAGYPQPSPSKRSHVGLYAPSLCSQRSLQKLRVSLNSLTFAPQKTHMSNGNSFHINSLDGVKQVNIELKKSNASVTKSNAAALPHIA
ncbi:hypothetical protein WDL1P1_00775 (plasmid) [Variovorax sp. WDL1]|nr:hypothetical protein WDL1P1_00775 [Variovorax sp. WDL1]